MLIDWFTVGAQALNFLILVWLLHRYLYKPILSGIDTREKGIAAKLADAEKQVKDAQKEHADYDKKTNDFDRQRGALLAKAADDAKAEHDHLMDDAKKEAGAFRTAQAKALQNDQARLSQEITNTAKDEVFAIARKALMDLATESLEERIGAVFTRRLGEMDRKSKDAMGAALKSAAEPALLQSAFEMPPQQQATIRNALNETFSSEVRVQFKTGKDSICGIELSANGQKVGWNISGYLTELDRKVGLLLAAK
jgi:F-type H+-transporting ATPase subunit b